MKDPYLQIIQQLQKRSISPKEFEDYLSLSLHTPFEKVSHSLKQRKISLSDYLAYLQQSLDFSSITSPSTGKFENKELLHTEALGQLLLDENRLSLTELNAILQSLPNRNFKIFIQQLMIERKIQPEELLPFLQGSVPASIYSNYYLEKLEGREFYLRVSKDQKKYGAYFLFEELGHGGMGVVYKAYHPKLNRFVALKVLLAGKSASEKLLQRFRREIEIMAKLQHEGIVQIYDSGNEGEEMYLAMEYVEGASLGSRISDLSLVEKICIVQEALIALHYAHKQGVIHRDLKLDNILITKENKPKIVDFGIAKLLQQETKNIEKLTEEGVIIGTAIYMAPEQARGNIQDTDARIDIYSMGVCLYYLLTQRFPHKAETLPQLLKQISNEDPIPPSHYVPNLRQDLEAILLKALATKKEERYSSAQTFAEDLKRLLQGNPVEAFQRNFKTQIHKSIRRNKKKLLFFLLGIICLVLLTTTKFMLNYYENYSRFQQKYELAKQEAQKAKSLGSQEAFYHYFQSWNALHDALQIWPQHPLAETKKWDVGEELLKESLKKNSRYLGDYVLQEMQQLISISENKIAERKQIWEQQKNERWQGENERFQLILSQIKEGKLSKGECKDTIFEIVKMTSPIINATLLQHIQEGNKFFEKEEFFNERECSFYLWIVQLLNRRKVKEALSLVCEGLSHLVEKEAQHQEGKQHLERIEYLVELSRYLLNVKVYTQADKLYQLRFALGENSLFWERTKFVNKKLFQGKLALESHLISLQTASDYLNRGKERVWIDDFEGAISDFTEAIRLNPQNPDLYNNRGNAKQEKKDLDGAILDYTEVIRLNPQSSVAYNNRGNSKQAKQDFEGAILDFSEALYLNPQYSEAYNNRGISKQSKKDLNGAISDYGEAIRLNPQFSDAYNNRGTAKEEKQDLDGAISDYTEAIHLNPQDSKAYNNRGLAKKNKKDLDGAISDLTEAIHLNPQYSEAYNNRGLAKKNKKDLDGALLDFGEAIHLNPQNSSAYNNRGNAKQDKKDFEGAILDYSQAIKLDPKNPIIYWGRGSLYFALKQREKAKKDFASLIFLAKTIPFPELSQMKKIIFQEFPELKFE